VTFLAELRAKLAGAVEEAGGRTVVHPASAAELAAVVQLARRHRAPLDPPGATGRPQAVAVELDRMSGIVAVDDASQIVHVQAGARLAAVEDELRRRGLTLATDGAPDDETVGGWLARGAPGARDHEDDPVDQVVAGLEAVLPDGAELAIRPAPRRAVGPDLVSAMIGARGRLGILTGAHLVARRYAPSRDCFFLFPTRAAAESARAWMRGRGVRPAATRIADAPEGASLRVRLQGENALLAARVETARRTAIERGGAEIDPVEAPALRDTPTSAESEIVLALARRLDPDGILGA
jgi:alkyldihydroxyacetonephosphate synthase